MSNQKAMPQPTSSAALVGVTVAPKPEAERQTPPPAGTPPAFGTAPAVGPDVSAVTFAEAEKLMRVELNGRDRAKAAENWRNSMAAVYERRTGSRKVQIPESVAPYLQVNPVLPGHRAHPAGDRFVRSDADPGPLPANDADFAFAPVWQLSRWIESRKLGSERLTSIYLARIARFDPVLHCVITLTRELGLRQARKADQEIAAGKYRGPLHGIPFGVRDLLDTAGILTTYGAEPYRDRVPEENAAVVARLE